MKKFIYILICLCSISEIKSQLAVTTGSTASQLVNNVLLGPGVVATNIQYTGATQAAGFFYGLASNIGLKSGVILSTGKVISAIGPNNTTSVTSQNGQAGNPQLTQICGQPTRDAAILEFDFIPSSDTVRFRYVFASEEYYEGVCTPYNDVFAFLISGPGITGTNNIALIPGTNKAVSISSVNGGVLGDPIYNPSISYTYCNLGYTNFYVDNTTPPGPTVQYDGFTKVFTAKSKVIPCQTYHIKMAIADGGNDDTWDSAVFLEAGSFNSHYLTVNNLPRYSGCTYNSAIAEGTGQATITFKRYDSIPYPRTLNYTISGSASPTDYNINAPNVHFNPGSDSANLIITPLTDNLMEGIETVSLTLIPDFIVCSGWTIPGGSINITDPPQLHPNFTSLTQEGCKPFCVQLTNITTGTNSVLWDFGDKSPTVQSPAVTHCYINKGNYDVKLVVTNSFGCKDSLTKVNYIAVYDNPIADFVMKNKYISLIDNKGIFNNATINAITYKWILDSVLISTAFDLEHQFFDTGCFVLQLVAIDGYGCKDTTSQNICVSEGFSFWVPNCFSPDNDGINDYLLPVGTGWKKETYNFEIINRWGATIFSSQNPYTAWDGKSGAGKFTDDIYIWKARVEDIYNKIHELNGHVLIMR
jgi:gliding motility-associated-like protein